MLVLMSTARPLLAARTKFPFAAQAFLFLLVGSLAPCLAATQATAPSPAAAAANADMLSWMAHGLLTAVVGLTVLTCLVLLIAFTTSRRVDSRPLAPAQAPATPAMSAATALATALAATSPEPIAA